MKWLSRLSSVLVLAVLLLAALPVRACPSCQEAIANSTPPEGDVEDLNQLGTAYNNSIYMMVGVPYLLLGIVGVMIYRGVRQNEQYRKELGDSEKPIKD